MPASERVITALAVLLLGVVLAGLTARRRLAVCISFSLYLAAVGVSDVLIAAWPGQFWRRSFWIVKENVHNLLKLAIVLELMVRVFHHFPTAYVSVRRAVILVIAVLGALVASSLGKGAEFRTVVGTLHPHVLDATVWLFVALGAYCLWYHLPLDSIHKAILIGMVPYLLFYSVVLKAIGALGSERAAVFNASAPYVYLAVLTYWGVVAWRRNPGDAGTRIKQMMPPAA